MNWSIQPVWPLGLIVLAGIALLAATAFGSLILYRRGASQVWIGRLAGLRMLVALLILLCLLRPGLHYQRKVEVRTDRLILVDTSASMALPGGSAGGTRLGNVLQQLQEPRWHRALLDAYDNHWFAFDSHARPLEESQLKALMADGADTHTGTAMEEAFDLYRGSDKTPGTDNASPRVLLISDGLDRGRTDALDIALQRGLTVDVLASEPAAASSEPEIGLSDVQYSRRLLLGSELRVQATVRQQGLAGVPLRLIMESDGQPVQVRKLTFAEAQGEQRVTLSVRPGVAGLIHYTLKLETDTAKFKPVFESSTGSEVVVRVESDHYEVLMIEPEWRWEFRYLRRVLESDPGFAFSGFLSRGPGVFIQFGESSRRVNLGGFPRTQAELEGFDTVILGDVLPSSLPPQLPEALYHMVVEQGKSLVVIAGPNLGAWSLDPRLASLLPVELYPESSGPLEGPVPVRLSVEGQASPFFFAPEGAPSVRRWPSLPPMAQIYAPLRKKPAATVLMEAPGNRNEFGSLIVAAVHTVGRGQVLYLATDSLWKWQMQGVMDTDGNTPYRVFWQQAMRAIRPERLSASPVNVWLHPDHTQTQVGQPVTVYARLDGDVTVLPLRLTGRIQLPDGRELPMVFSREPESPDRYQSQFEASLPGVYEIQAEVFASGQSLGQSMTSVNASERSSETEPLPPNIAGLERLATGSGGMMLTPSVVDALPAATETAPVRTEMRDISLNLWSNLFLILALTLVLGIDWLIRLMRGYA